MPESPEDQQFEQLVRTIDPHSKLLRVWQLKGGVSAHATALEIARPDGQTQKIVVRQHGEADLKANPHIAADEFRLLQCLQSAGLPVPAPCYLDQSGEIFPTPYIVVKYIEGAPEFAPADLTDFIYQSAANLVAIHRVAGASVDLSFLPQQTTRCTQNLKQRPAKLDESLDEGRIRAALESAWPLPQVNPSGLLHGDFWPGNLLWKSGQLAAVIDWEDAALGDPLADLANSRLEMLWAFGIDAMDRFTYHYQLMMTAMDYSYLPYWDLWAALRPANKLDSWTDVATAKMMRESHKWFVTQAFEKLPVQTLDTYHD